MKEDSPGIYPNLGPIGVMIARLFSAGSTIQEIIEGMPQNVRPIIQGQLNAIAITLREQLNRPEVLLNELQPMLSLLSTEKRVKFSLMLMTGIVRAVFDPESDVSVEKSVTDALTVVGEIISDQRELFSDRPEVGEQMRLSDGVAQAGSVADLWIIALDPESSTKEVFEALRHLKLLTKVLEIMGEVERRADSLEPFKKLLFMSALVEEEGLELKDELRAKMRITSLHHPDDNRVVALIQEVVGENPQNIEPQYQVFEGLVKGKKYLKLATESEVYLWQDSGEWSWVEIDYRDQKPVKSALAKLIRKFNEHVGTIDDWVGLRMTFPNREAALEFFRRLTTKAQIGVAREIEGVSSLVIYDHVNSLKSANQQETSKFSATNNYSSGDLEIWKLHARYMAKEIEAQIHNARSSINYDHHGSYGRGVYELKRLRDYLQQLYPRELYEIDWDREIEDRIELLKKQQRAKMQAVSIPR